MRQVTMLVLIVAVLGCLPDNAGGQAPPQDFKARMLERMAAEQGDTPEVRALLEGNAPNARDKVLGRTALMWSVRLYQPEAFNRFMAGKDVDVNARDDNGETALMNACMYGQRFATESMMQELLKRGADVNALDKLGKTALWHSVQVRRFDYVSPLLAKGARVNSPDVEGLTPLMWASGGGNLNSVRKLLEAGADVKAKSKDGSTALLFAANYNAPEAVEIVRLLLEKGPDVHAKNVDGLGPLDVAIMAKSQEVVELLKKAGAVPSPKKEP